MGIKFYVSDQYGVPIANAKIIVRAKCSSVGNITNWTNSAVGYTNNDGYALIETGCYAGSTFSYTVEATGYAQETGTGAQTGGILGIGGGDAVVKIALTKSGQSAINPLGSITAPISSFSNSINSMISSPLTSIGIILIMIVIVIIIAIVAIK